MFGVFGISPHADGSIDFDPVYNREIGKGELKGFQFRGHSYDVVMEEKYYRVRRDGRLVGEKLYGEKISIENTSQDE